MAETDNNRCEICGSRMTEGWRGSRSFLYCPNVNCQQIPATRLETLRKQTTLKVKETKGVVRFL